MHMKKHLAAISLSCVALLPACSLFEPGEYAPIYLQEPSPLDPPGMEAVRAEARAKYVKEGLYADGEVLEVQQGKAVLFNRNPDYYEGAAGSMETAASARIISCEGLYYFVELDNGRKGFLRETDFVSPHKIVSTLDSESATGAAASAAAATPLPANAEMTLTTDTAGRTVRLVKKTTEKSDEFKAKVKEIQDQGAANDGGLPTPTAELPEPAGSEE